MESRTTWVVGAALLVVGLGQTAVAERTEIAVTAQDVAVLASDPFEVIFAVDLPALSEGVRLDFAMLEMDVDVAAGEGGFVPFMLRVVPAELGGAAAAISSAVPGEALVSRAGSGQRVRIDVTGVVRECLARGAPYGMSIAVDETVAEDGASVAVASGATVARVRLFTSRR